MYKKLGISVDEQKKMNNVAMDIVIDSVSVATTFKKTLGEKGIIFMSISEAIKEREDKVLRNKVASSGSTIWKVENLRGQFCSV